MDANAPLEERQDVLDLRELLVFFSQTVDRVGEDLLHQGLLVRWIVNGGRGRGGRVLLKSQNRSDKYRKYTKYRKCTCTCTGRVTNLVGQ